MKKFQALLLTGFMVVLLSGFYLSAQESRTDISIHSGVITDESFSFDPYLWLIGINVDYFLSNHLIFSPECNLIIHEFDFSYTFLEPAVIVNFLPDHFFIGGGLAKMFLIGDGSDISTDFSLKLNVGYKSDYIKLRVFLITPFDDLFGPMLFGVTLAISF